MNNTDNTIVVENNSSNWDLDMDLDIMSRDITQNDMIKSMNSTVNDLQSQQNNDVADDLENDLAEDNQDSVESKAIVNKTEAKNEIAERIEKERKFLEETVGKSGNAGDSVKDSDNNDSDNPEESDELSVVELIKELQLLDIPEDYANKDDLTDEDLYKLAEHTRNKRKEEVIKEMSSNIKDEYEKELFDYWRNPSKDKNLPAYKEMLDDIKYYGDLDIKDKNNQREVLTFLLKEGLDPNNPAHAFKLNSIDLDLERIMNSDQAEQQAELAKKHIQTLINTQRLEEKQRVSLLAQQEKEAHEKQLALNQQWFNNINERVNGQPWDDSVKKKVFTELYNEVKVGDDVKPQWLAKLDMINSSESLHIKFIEFLSTFDMKTKTFKYDISDKQIKKTAISKIKKLTDRKVKRGNSRRTIRNNNSNNDNTIILDSFF